MVKGKWGGLGSAAMHVDRVEGGGGAVWGAGGWVHAGTSPEYRQHTDTCTNTHVVSQNALALTQQS